MQPTSQAWKNEHKKILVGESYVEIFYDVTDPSLLADVIVSDNGSVSIANTPQIVNEVKKNIVPYATLERNLVVLDGSAQEIPVSNLGDTGFISQFFSNDLGVFNVVPIINMSFSVIRYPFISGVIIKWADAHDEYAESFRISAYNNNILVAEKRVDDNHAMATVVRMDIQGYDLIRIEIFKWSMPLRRARISHIFIGVRKIYNKDNLTSFEHIQEVDPIASQLPKNAVKFEIDNTSDAYNPINPDGQAKYIIERQEIRTRYGYKIENNIEWIDGGVFYMTDWGTTQNGLTASFEARDILEFMHTTYRKGIYVSAGRSLYDLAIDVLHEANLALNADGSVKWVIDESLKNIFTTAPIPLLSLSDCLMRIANAAECVLFVDRKGNLHIEPFVNIPVEYSIDNFNSFRKSEISLTKPLFRVSVDTYTYSPEEEISNLYDGTININGIKSIWVHYNSPAINVTALVTNGTLMSAEYYTHACLLTITANGDVSMSITGNLLKIAKAVISVDSVTVEEIVIPFNVNNDEGETFKIDNPLITTTERALAICEWVKDHLDKRRVISSEWRADPAIDAFDIIPISSNYGTNLTMLTLVALTYNGAFRGISEGRIL